MDWQTITSSWGFNWAFLASIAIGGLIAYWTYSPRERWRLSYSVESSTIVDQMDGAFSDNITIMFNDMQIPRATLSRVHFWNSGNKSLRRADITPKSPLAITIPGGQHILQKSISSMAIHAMDVELFPEDEGAVSIRFEYVEPNQGFICEILHTGAHHDIEVEGILVSAQEPVKEELAANQISGRAFFAIMSLGLGVPIAAVYAMTIYIGPTDATPLFTFVGFALFMVLSVAWIFLLFHFAVNRKSKKLNFGTSKAER